MSRSYGLADECLEKISEDPKDPGSIFNHINKVFD